MVSTTQKHLRNQFKVCIGGGPVSQSFANQIGADGYSKNAADAVRLVNDLLGTERKELVS